MVFGVLGLTAVITEMVVVMGRGRFVPENFFGFFTIESNIIAGLVFILSALAILVLGAQPKLLVFLRGAATLYMMITGIVFAVLLAGLDVELTAVPWDNIVLHYIIPLAIVIDWILDPPQVRIPFNVALIWFCFPILYLVYSLVRGGIVGWYPYPFLNPGTNGYGGVIWVSLGIVLLALVLTWLLTQGSMKRRAK